MTFYTPTFNVEQFELRDQIDPYLTEDQTADVTLTTTRVNEQLDWVAQLLGWNGSYYWTNLVSTVDQKRQLLTGSFGVYNSFTIPRVLEVRNWSNEIIIDYLSGVSEGQTCYINTDTAVIDKISIHGSSLILSLSEVTSTFYDQFSLNFQLKIDSEKNRPAPFYRPSPGAAADTSFICSSENNTLVLYPSWDIHKTTPYKFNILVWGARYYFDQPVYFSVSRSPLTTSITPIYDDALGLWYLDFFAENTVNPISTTGFLVWTFSNRTALQNAITEIVIQAWEDPSDWNTVSTLNNFSGVWSNKGGVLPFNFCFDALSIHGFDEEKSLYLNSIQRRIDFNQLVNLAYYQKTPQNAMTKGNAKVGDVWWNSETGVFSVYPPSSVSCGSWIEVSYRQDPEPPLASNFTYSTVAQFAAAVNTIPVGSVVRITNVTGLQAEGSTYQVMNLTAPLPASGSVLLVKSANGRLFDIEEFIFDNVTQFRDNALFLPIKTVVRLINPSGLRPEESGDYIVRNLKYEITPLQAYEILLTKQYSSLEWQLSPSSILRFIGNTRLFGGVGSPQQGEMWWDFTNPDPLTRAAFIWYQSAWVAINPNPTLGSEPGVVSFQSVEIYCDGELLEPGMLLYTENFTIQYTINNTTGQFNFDYKPRNLVGKTQFPVIVVSDALTSAYRVDISNLVFSGVQYYMSPNVWDSETPLRLWRNSSLQVANTLSQLNNNTYNNPLVADYNTGPSDNWNRFFIRLPVSYQRNSSQWFKSNLIGQDFTYYGSSPEPERMECPPESNVPAIYEELVLYPQLGFQSGLIYSEPYLYSNVGFYQYSSANDYSNSTILPSFDITYDQFDEAYLVDYDPLHNRIAKTSTSNISDYGDWEGTYMYATECTELSGFLVNDENSGAVQPARAPEYDASIYKFPPLCTQDSRTFSVDANIYKTCYAYFVADLSAADEGFFDVQQSISWRNSVNGSKTGYVLPAAG